ncbi:hypothetical protein MTO96_025097 [Rhipicephalus appendiculatus]
MTDMTDRERAASPSTDVTTTRRSCSAAPDVLGGPATVESRVSSARSPAAVAGRKPTQMCVTPLPTSATWPTVQGRGVGVRRAQQFFKGCRSTFRQPRGEKPPPRTNGGGGRKCRAQTQL